MSDGVDAAVQADEVTDVGRTADRGSREPALEELPDRDRAMLSARDGSDALPAIVEGGHPASVAELSSHVVSRLCRFAHAKVTFSFTRTNAP